MSDNENVILKKKTSSFINASTLTQALDTGLRFPSIDAVVQAKKESSKSVNPTTYNRFEKYHDPYDPNSLLSRIFEAVYSKIKPLMRKLHLYND